MVSEVSGFSGSARQPTFYERELQRKNQEAGVADVLLDPRSAPKEFWNVVMELAKYYLPSGTDDWAAWKREMLFMTGWDGLKGYPSDNFGQIVRHGTISLPNATQVQRVDFPTRAAAIELMMDIAGSYADQFADRGQRPCTTVPRWAPHPRPSDLPYHR